MVTFPARTKCPKCGETYIYNRIYAYMIPFDDNAIEIYLEKYNIQCKCEEFFNAEKNFFEELSFDEMVEYNKKSPYYKYLLTITEAFGQKIENI